MDRITALKILDMQEKMLQDPEYRKLAENRERMNASFLAVMDSLTEKQEAEVLNYLGYLMEIHYKTIEHLMK